jgi:beta-glucosidase
MVPLGLTPASALEAPEHRAHALKMARQSIVLLKNQYNTLPISKNIKKIAVIGPNADNAITQLGNYNGAPSRVVTVLEGIKNKVGNNVEIIYEKAINYADDSVMVYNDITELFKVADTKGVRVAFYNNMKLEGTPAYTGIVKGIDHYRSEGLPAYNGVSPSNFSARFSTSFLAPQSKEINFEAAIDGNYRIYINDKIMVDNWNKRNIAPEELSLNVKQGENYSIVIEYHHGEGPSTIKFKSGQKVKANFNALAQKLRSADVIVFAGGISPQLEGEEMPVAVPGFKGGDRTSIMLPAIQTELLKALKITGKPVVFVMMTGSALAIPWEDENIPAIINAWYGGQSSGEAVADVLFGDYNPAGRLPVTFYRSDSDLPDFSNYDMANRTYRYFKGMPLYPFGYGLSYSQFKYSNLQIPKTVKKGKKITVSAKVTNLGKRDGDEVVQLYISYKSNSFKSPVQALKGFDRIFLKEGETKTVRFQLTPEHLSVINQNGQAFQPKGEIVISLGGGQPYMQNKTSGNILYGKFIIN